jgi:hypothetical protein
MWKNGGAACGFPVGHLTLSREPRKRFAAPHVPQPRTVDIRL